MQTLVFFYYVNDVLILIRFMLILYSYPQFEHYALILISISKLLFSLLPPAGSCSQQVDFVARKAHTYTIFQKECSFVPFVRKSVGRQS